MKPEKVGPCPECGRDDFKFFRSLGRHRQSKHGISGRSKSAVASRKPKTTKEKTLVVKSITKEKTHEKNQAHDYEIAVVSGAKQAEILFLFLAAQLNVPPRQLAADCAQHILHATGR